MYIFRNLGKRSRVSLSHIRNLPSEAHIARTVRPLAALAVLARIMRRIHLSMIGAAELAIRVVVRPDVRDLCRPLLLGDALSERGDEVF